MKTFLLTIITLFIFGCTSTQKDQTETYNKKPLLAETPPMGWNSWDSYGFEITEKEVKEVADYMEANLLEYGYNYLVVDMGWYYPLDYKAGMTLQTQKPAQSIDKWGRLIPDTKKYPSAVNGKGFKPLADYVHQKGLKFGIHIMRGIPWNAVENRLQIKGTNYTAEDVYSTDILCEWNHSNYGINCDHAAGKAYYASIVELYKSWEVDYIKIDDIARPLNKPELKAFSEAVRESGRDIVISLSPGPSPVEEANYLSEYAHLWRISNDIWDFWDSIKRNFEHCSDWSGMQEINAWPDADMLPIGKLRITGGDAWVASLLKDDAANIADEYSRLTSDEQYTVMNLWTVFKSPLMIGGYLPHNNDLTNRLLTNRALIELTGC